MIAVNSLAIEPRLSAYHEDRGLSTNSVKLAVPSRLLQEKPVATAEPLCASSIFLYGATFPVPDNCTDCGDPLALS
jgi:hypothetical protein